MLYITHTHVDASVMTATSRFARLLCNAPYYMNAMYTLQYMSAVYALYYMNAVYHVIT